MTPPGRRPRTKRRADERAARELVRERQKLALLSPGGAAERPIEVDSSSVIEVRAAALPCPLCAGRLRVDEHHALTARLREVRVSCQQCGVGRGLWFRIGSPLGN